MLDGLRVHHSRKVRDWLEVRHEHPELFFTAEPLPGLNPDEYLSCALKARLNGGRPVGDGNQLKGKALSHLRAPQKQPQRIRLRIRRPRKT